jgi:hypothetical protein
MGFVIGLVDSVQLQRRGRISFEEGNGTKVPS